MDDATAHAEAPRRRRVTLHALLVCMGIGLVLWAAFNAFQWHVTVKDGVASWEPGNIVGRAVLSGIAVACFALVPWLCVAFAAQFPAATGLSRALWVVLTLTAIAALVAMGLFFSLMTLMSFQS